MSERTRSFVPAPHGTAFGDWRGINNNQTPLHSGPSRPHQSEPRLDDMLADPIVQRLMERDGVQMTTLLSLIAETKRRLR